LSSIGEEKTLSPMAWRVGLPYARRKIGGRITRSFIMNSIDAVKNVNRTRDLATKSQQADGEEAMRCVDRRPKGRSSEAQLPSLLPSNWVGRLEEGWLIVISPRCRAV
jgi:hypothetical protein